MHTKRWFVLGALAACTTGCPADEENDTSGSPTSVASDESTGGASMTTTDGMTGQMTTATTTVATTDMTSESTGSPPAEPQENGAACELDEECISGYCYVIDLLGGICGECNADADCEAGGCSLPNPLAVPPVGAHCNMGEPGAGCMSDDVCQDGYVCATILEVPGILEASTCSECLTDADCDTGLLCSPTYDVLNISGQNLCREPGSVPNGEGCNFMGTGDDACMSGLCAMVDIMMLLQVGVCGDCEVDVDCTAPDVCLPADIDIATGMVTPPTCGPMP
jgi:hypothetical protein